MRAGQGLHILAYHAGLEISLLTREEEEGGGKMKLREVDKREKEWKIERREWKYEEGRRDEEGREKDDRK